jgi:hypothetical protein
MTEQDLIDTINALIDAGVRGECTVLNPKDIARRAIDRCGEGVFTTEAVTDLVCQIFTIRCEPRKVLPGTRRQAKQCARELGARGDAMIDDEAAWRAEIGADDPEVIEAHLDGARKLQLWEDRISTSRATRATCAVR